MSEVKETWLLVLMEIDINSEIALRDVISQAVLKITNMMHSLKWLMTILHQFLALNTSSFCNIRQGLCLVCHSALYCILLYSAFMRIIVQDLTDLWEDIQKKLLKQVPGCQSIAEHYSDHWQLLFIILYYESGR